MKTNGTINIDIKDLDLSIWNYGNYVVTAPIDSINKGNSDIKEEKYKVKWEEILEVLK